MTDRSVDRASEERDLAEADRHIAEGEQRLARQRALIQRLAADGHDTKEAERLWANFAEVLETARAHRQQILSRLGKDSGRTS